MVVKLFRLIFGKEAETPMVDHDQNSNPGESTSSQGGTQTGGQGSPYGDDPGQIPYDPNKDVSITSSVPVPQLYGDGNITTNINTCQETLRQWGLKALSTVKTSSDEVDMSGVRENRRVNSDIGTSVSAEETSVPPADAVTSSLPSGQAPGPESGIPTDFEDTFRGMLEQTSTMIREILADMRITVNGKEFHIQCGGGESARSEQAGEPTSEEDDDVTIGGPRVQVDVRGPSRMVAGENMVHLITEAGGQPISVLAAGDAGQPTQGDSGATSWLMNSKAAVDQIGISNIAGLTISFNVQVLNIQGTFTS